MIIYTENGLPLDLDLQVYFVDSINFEPVDSLFNDTNRTILLSGALDADDKIISPNANTSDVQLTRQQIQNIWDIGDIIIQANVETKDSQDPNKYVKFYSDYSLYFRLSAEAEISLTIEENPD